MTYDEVTANALNYLKQELNYTPDTLKRYSLKWLKLRDYMKSQNQAFINPDVCRAYLFTLFDGRSFRDLSRAERTLKRSVSILAQFMERGTLKKEERTSDLDGVIGTMMKDFLAFKCSQRLIALTIQRIECHLSRFNLWLTSHNVFEINDIEQKHVIGFIKSLNPTKKALVHDTLLNLRAFFKYTYEKGNLAKNIAASIPKDNYKYQSQIPSYYSENEIHVLLQSINRGTSIGKRDYAIMVLAAYLGLRASDIALLKFEKLNWECSTIRIEQYKTGVYISLPLLPIVGNAILDYIQYGRPKSNEHYVFLTAVSPYLPIKPNNVSVLASRKFRSTNLNLHNRKHGSHALRHSLVKEMLKNRQTLPVITEVLGHRNMQSTRHYIRIDLVSLSQCALEVPGVDAHFYTQKGGGIIFMKKKEPQSIYAPYIKEFIDMKRSLGYQYVNEETSFLNFDKFLKSECNGSIGITKGLTDLWVDKHPNDSAIHKYKRLAFIKQFSEHLINQGFKSYVPPLPKYPDKTFIPYIYSYEDICSVFSACDELRLSRRKTNTALLIMPCLLRMLYGTGIRISEALSLRNKDVNVDEQHLVINESKNGKQRLLPFTNSLADVCVDYLRHRNKIPIESVNDPDKYFFVSPIGLPCKVNAIHVWFYQILVKAGITIGGINQSPRIHDLRHSFACHSFLKLSNEGVDLYCSWPYLSAYLGHQSLRMTEQYIRLSSQMYPELLKGTDGLYVNIISEDDNKSEL